MRFGIFYEHQLPRPWAPDDEHRLLKDALEQVELADWQGPARDGCRVDDRGGRASQRREAVQDRLELLDRPQVQLQEVAVFAGDAVALGDLGQLAGDIGDQLEVTRARAD